jgi:hypothetical protein
MIERYEVLRQPCDTWAVFDTLSGLPAEQNGELLLGLSKAAAEQAGCRLNAIVPPPSRYRHPTSAARHFHG